jgi:DNA modification methylase/plasmid maintenance system antidote protein VapI
MAKTRTQHAKVGERESAFGQMLRREREAAGVTLSALASRLKVSKGYLSRLETGKTLPSADMVARIAGILGSNSTVLSVLAGQLPADVQEILQNHPVEALDLLRESYPASDEAAPVCRDASGTVGLAAAAGELATRPELSDNSVMSLRQYETVLGDCLDWLAKRQESSIHAVVTDPPYGLREYTEPEKAKLRAGRGGVWRIPPSFDGCTRSPLPRFTVLTDQDQQALADFFARWARLVFKVLVPGGHVFVATNPLVSQLVYAPMLDAGFEKRGEIIRLVQTLRGGDRPKNAHQEFSGVTVMPRSAWEPWGLFRKPCEGRVQDNLRKWQTGGLRRVSAEQPFTDVIKSAPTRNGERAIAPHPSLKPQAFMRQIVRAALPLGSGIVLDPFMGAGSTIAAACAVGYRSIGIEMDPEFYRVAVAAIPKLARLTLNGSENCRPVTTSQSSLFLLH